MLLTVNHVPTHKAAAYCVSSANPGTAKVAPKPTASRHPAVRSRRRLPFLRRSRSDNEPITGCSTMSTIFGRNSVAPASQGLTPRVSVRKYNSSRPGTVT